MIQHPHYCPPTRRSGWRVLGELVRLLGCVFAVSLSLHSPLRAQPPGTFPPSEVLTPRDNPVGSEDLKVDGFLLLDESKSRVLMPGMTLEQAQWLMQMQSSAPSQKRPYIFEEVSIDGQVDGQRAELTVSIRMKVEATGGETIEIPLAMENFHRVGSVEFLEGANVAKQLGVNVNEATGRYELVANLPVASMIELRMKMSSRVEEEGTQSLDFRLPAAPTKISITTDQRDAVATIPNRDDEVLSNESDDLGRSRFVVESSGGRFTLQWGAVERPLTAPLLESTSNVQLQWNAPQEQLIEIVRMTVRDARRPISSLTVRLPTNSVLRDDIRLVTSGQFGQTLEYSSPNPKEAELIQIAIPKVERRQSIVLEFQLELAAPEDPSAQQPFELSVPTVESAIRNQGSIGVSTGSDYRLRWRDRPYVKLMSTAEVEESTVDRRLYEFDFIRGGFKLPLWLDATKRELRVNSSVDIELRDDYLNLFMEIDAVGNSSRAQLLSVDLADWQVFSIENARTGAPLYWYESDGYVEIETNYSGMEESNKVLIKADRLLENLTEASISDPLLLPIPRVVGSGDQRDPVMIQSADVTVSGGGRRTFVVDLASSKHVERLASENTEGLDTARTFTVMPPESAAQLVGVLVVQPPRLVVQPSAEFDYLAGRMRAAIEWDVESQTDLEGRLRIGIPRVQTQPEASRSGSTTVSARDDAGSEASTAANEIDPTISEPSSWYALVNDLPAELRPVAQEDTSMASEVDYYELISDALAEERFRIRLETSRPVSIGGGEQQKEFAVGLPFPVVQDVTLRGEFTIGLSDDGTRDFALLSSPTTDGWSPRSLPERPLLFRLSAKPPSKSSLATGDVIVRTAISEFAQHDQVLLLAEGTGEFPLKLRKPGETIVDVKINGAPASHRITQGTLFISVPPLEDTQLIDIRMWSDRDQQTGLAQIRPLVRSGMSPRMEYWQLMMPSSEHLVWATPSLGRLMSWAREGLKLVRKPLVTEAALLERVAKSKVDLVDLSAMPTGNQYLFSAVDSRMFVVRAASQSLLWLWVSGAVVLMTALLTYWPRTRHPITVAIAIMMFSGIVFIAPDSAIIAGQISLLSLTLVIVMVSIRHLILPPPSRVLTSSRSGSVERGSEPSRPDVRPRSSATATFTIGSEDLASAHDEVAS